MTTPTFALPLPAPIPSTDKKKRLLLIDDSPLKRDLRAEMMRKLGIEVDCAANIQEARSWWRADLYNLVLINIDSNVIQRDEFCEDIRRGSPPQRFAFLVGKPGYLANVPKAGTELQEAGNHGHARVDDRKAVLAGGLAELPERWGILEASRRISSVRSAYNARAQAMRSVPSPPRDSEIRLSKRTMVSKTLDDLLREEMQ